MYCFALRHELLFTSSKKKYLLVFSLKTSSIKFQIDYVIIIIRSIIAFACGKHMYYFVGLYHNGPKLTPFNAGPYWCHFLNVLGLTLIDKHITPAVFTPYHEK